MPTTVVPAPDAAALTVTLLPEVTTDSPAERAWVLAYAARHVAKILTRAAEVATDRPELLAGQRIRPARLGGVPATFLASHKRENA